MKGHAFKQIWHYSPWEKEWSSWKCRCGKEYLSSKHNGYASRSEARIQHRIHLKEVERGT